MNAHLNHAPQSKENPKKPAGQESAVSMPSQVLVRAQLEMTKPGDSDELEADAVADSIVKEGKIARAVSGGHSGGGIALPSQMGSQLTSMQGHGSQLYGNLKTQMESGFGRDFSDVRLHTGDAAAEMSESISARAFTYGNDIFFNRGQFNPGTPEGQHLIAHELTHVTQGGDSVRRQSAPPDIETPDVVPEDSATAPVKDTETHAEKLQRIATTGTEEDLIDLLISSASAEADSQYREKEVIIKKAEIEKVGKENTVFYALYKDRESLSWSELRAKEIQLNDQKNKTTDNKKKGEITALLKGIDTVRKDYLKDRGTVILEGEKQDMSFKEFLSSNGSSYESTFFSATNGNGNVTRYHTEYSQDWAMGDAWCDWFVHWCFVNAFHPLGLDRNDDNQGMYDALRRMVLQNTMFEYLDFYTDKKKKKFKKPYRGTRGSVSNNQNLYVNAGKKAVKYNDTDSPDSGIITYIDNSDGQATPMKGDVIIFKKPGAKAPHHIGLVVNVKGDIVYTIEGNTGSGGLTRQDVFDDSVDTLGESNQVEANGNGVYYKKYNKTDKIISGYGRPDYKGLLESLKSYYKKQEELRILVNNAISGAKDFIQSFGQSEEESPADNQIEEE